MRRFIAENQSVLLALAIGVALAAWLVSGADRRPSAADADKTELTARASPAFSVRVVTVEAEPVARDVVLYGRTEPARTVTLRAELDGRVVAVGPARGAPVSKGDLIARLDVRDLEAQREQALATVELRALQFQAAQRLEQHQFQSQTALAEARANLAAARARVKEVQVAMDKTAVRAPFDGILETRPVEIGDYLSPGDAVARIIEVDPLRVTGYVTQRELGFVTTGAAGTAQLVTGETVAGTVRYVSAESDEATRTFRVELEVPNRETRLAAGVTAEIRITTPPASAHLITPALLALDARDRIGVKAVDDTDRVTFHPVQIVTSDSRGVWVSGLPSRARVITVGHGFVRPGDIVNPVPDDGGDATRLGAQRTGG